AVHDIRQDRPESLALPALDLIEPDMPRLPFDAGAIPLRQEGFLGATGFAPAHAVSHGRMAGRHRLTVHANLLAQPARHPRFRIRELDALGPDAARPTPEPPLGIDERHVMRGPRQVVPRSIQTRTHPGGASATAAAGVTPHPASLNPNHQAPALSFFDGHDSKSRQPENPRTIAPRSHRSSLV